MRRLVKSPLLHAVLALALIWALTAAAIGDNYATGVMYGDSMAPTITHGQILTASKDLTDPAPGAIIAFRKEHSTGNVVVKRVHAGPGQMVKDPRTGGTYPLLSDEYWVLGDNAAVSVDSRHYGPITQDRIIGVITDVRTP